MMMFRSKKENSSQQRQNAGIELQKVDQLFSSKRSSNYFSRKAGKDLSLYSEVGKDYDEDDGEEVLRDDLKSGLHS